MIRFKMIAMALAGTAMVAGSALAADLPQRSPAPAPIVAPPIFTWTGFYVGGQVGYGWGSDRWQAISAGAASDRAPGTRFTHRQTGFVGGGQIGYNWQYNQLVLGAEGALTFGRINGTRRSTFGAADDIYRTRVNTLGSVAARLGFAVDRALIYGRAGWGFANVRRRVRDTVAPNVGTSTRTRWHNGVVLGAGVEYAVTNNWVAGLEYNYYWFGRKRTSWGSTFTGTRDNHRPRVHTISLRLNYLFGGPSGSVTAKY